MQQSWGYMTDTEQNPEGSRRRLVLAAVELVLEHFDQGTGLRDVFAYLTPGAVAERAGLSRGLIYHHWGNVDADGGDAFVDFLTSVSDELWDALSIPEELNSLIPLLPDNPSDLVRELSDHEVARVAGEEGATWRAVEMLVLHGVPQNPQGVEDDMNRLGEFYELAFAKTGREVVPPLTSRDVAVAVACLFEGFALQVLSQPDRLLDRYDWTPEIEPQMDQQGWTLLAISVESLMLRMTRPVGDPDPPGRRAGPDRVAG